MSCFYGIKLYECDVIKWLCRDFYEIWVKASDLSLRFVDQRQLKARQVCVKNYLCENIIKAKFCWLKQLWIFMAHIEYQSCIFDLYLHKSTERRHCCAFCAFENSNFASPKKIIARQKTFVLTFSHPFIHSLPHNLSTKKLFKTTKVHINSPSFCPRQQCCEIANNPVIMRTVTVLLMLSNILGSVPIQHSQWSNYSKSTNLLLDLIGNYLWAIMSLNGAANCQRFLRSFCLITDKKLNESLTARLFPLAILSKYFFVLTIALPRGRYQTNFSLIYYSNCDLNWIYFLIGTFSLLSSHWTAAISRGLPFQLHLRILIFQWRKKKTLLRSLDVHLLPSLDNKEVSLANFIIHSESRRKKSFN